MTSGVALRIDALNGEAGQVLHSSSPRLAGLLTLHLTARCSSPAGRKQEMMARIVARVTCGVKGKDHKI